MDDLPYRAEYAKTSRASCKSCKTHIEKGVLRLAIMVQSHMFDGKTPNWYHTKCFFKKQRPQSEGDFENFLVLRLEDQNYIREQINNPSADVPDGKGKKGKRSAKSDPATRDFGVEYAASGRATCRGCEIKILKDEVRIKKVVFDTEVGMKYGGQPLWHHVECFAKLRDELGWNMAGNQLPGFGSLTKDDQTTVKKALPASGDAPAVKKIKLEPKEEADTKQLDELIAKQNKEFYRYRDLLENCLSKKELAALLEANGSHVPVGIDAILDRLADFMTFGVLKHCKKCPDKGELVFHKNGYVCIGEVSEWAKCNESYKEPERIKFKIPSEFKHIDFLKKYKCKVQNRAIKYVAPSTSTIARNIKKEEPETKGPKVQRDKPPLYNMEFCIVGRLKIGKDEMKSEITKRGGKLVTGVSNTLIAVISNEKEVEKLNALMGEAKILGIPVIPEDFINDIKTYDTSLEVMANKSICDWGTDRSAILHQIESKSMSNHKSKSIYTKSVPKSVKLTLKGGTAVDPDSGLEDVAHVYVKQKDKYTAVLALTDIQSGKNSYYKLQVLESDKSPRKYWLFRSWGRIGTSIGDHKLERMDTVYEAIDKFQELYLEKTENDWSERHNFQKVPKKMYPIDIDYCEDEKVRSLSEKSSIPSKLDTNIQELVKLLFDIDAMKKVMVEFELDMEKMPLGKLSQNQIQSALKVLSELNEAIVSGGSNAAFIQGTNKFFTLIPHDFGVDNPPLLDTAKLISEKSEMLESLMELEIAYGLLNTEVDEKLNPIDGHYEQLKTDLDVVSKESDEFERIIKYVKNTHAETHDAYDLEIINIFKVVRKGEDRRYKPFKKMHNRKLLWHGSRLTNYVGILTHGLKIAPPEAPVTGYMFGKGIYFADMVSKSANYCFTNVDNNTGLLMLCEVALGDCKEYTEANYVTKLPKDKHSVKGVGKTFPDPSQSFMDKDGVEIPFGEPIQKDIKTSLLYNEYIVYDPAQVKVKYLLKTKFNYKF